MSRLIRVAVDAMGGDNAPGVIADGVIDALNERNELAVTLVGRKEDIEKALEGKNYPSDRLSIRDAREVIEMAETPTSAIRRKKDSSIVVALRMVKDGEADAFASAGSSGAILVGGQAIVGRIRGIQRPPFGAVIPTRKGASLLLDSGANVDVRSDHLVQFARIGTIYMRDVLGVADPKVGLINIGAEKEKGNALVKETFPLLEEDPDIHFAGSVEARDIPEGGVDVLVADGFAGNIVLKMYEGTATALLGAVKEGLMSTLRSKIGALLIKPSLKGVLSTYDATAYGGAPMLGLNALVVKMHGSAKAKEVKNAMFQCIDFVKADISDKIRDQIVPPEKVEVQD